MRQQESLENEAPAARMFCNTTLLEHHVRKLERRTMNGKITDGLTATARVVVPQASVDRVRQETAGIEVRLASDPRISVSAQLIREVPQATDQLPSRALGSSAGGDIAVDMRDLKGATSLNPLFVVDLVLPEYSGLYHVGQKVLVRFRHQARPLGKTWLQKVHDFVINQSSKQ
jgi:putative peptide zinc metalloprotease protein